MTKIQAAVVGQAIGDAAGSPFEFVDANNRELQAWKGELRFSNVWHLKAGQYTDDTKMALYLGESIAREGRFDAKSVAEAYVAWVRTGDLRGIGSTCGASIRKYSAERNLDTCGAEGKYAAGNGTAMRVSPIGLASRNLPELVQSAIADANLTHRNRDAQAGSIAIALAVRLLARVEDPSPAAARAVVQKVLATFRLLGTTYSRTLVCAAIKRALKLADDGVAAPRALLELGTGGWVVHTVGASFFCLLATRTFRDAVVTAVKGGGDADTTGAVVGALAGAFYGLQGIPADYLATVEDRDRLTALDAALFARSLTPVAVEPRVPSRLLRSEVALYALLHGISNPRVCESFLGRSRSLVRELTTEDLATLLRSLETTGASVFNASEIEVRAGVRSVAAYELRARKSVAADV